MPNTVSCYSKNLQEPFDSLRVDFRQHYRRFNFLPRIHAKHLDAIRSAENSALVPDIAAAVLAHLRDQGEYVSNLLIEHALEYCHDVLLDLGYQYRHLGKVAESSPSDRAYAMLILGCQNRRILAARVGAAYAVIKTLRRPYRLVFSGLNPKSDSTGAKTGKVRTVWEALEMEDMFFRLKEADPQGDEIQLDSTSTVDLDAVDTVSNIEGFIRSGVLDTTRQRRVFLVSSTSHLMRIASIADRLFRDISPEQLVLVGGEHYSAPADVPYPSAYLKTMMHDVFSNLIDQKRSTSET
jgi:hypothetical protein